MHPCFSHDRIAIVLRFFAIFAVSLIMATPLWAQLPETCDEEFMDTMTARATMGGQREMEIAANIIRKPDSVLEYSCFTDRLKHLAATSQSLLSANTSPPLFGSPPPSFQPRDIYQPVIQPNQGPAPGTVLEGGATLVNYGIEPPDPASGRVTVPGIDHINQTFRDVLIDTMAGPDDLGHLVENFNHGFLGGTSGAPGKNCETMERIWTFAKCQNFDKNNFISFKDLVGTDPRKLPEQCSGSDRANWSQLMQNGAPNPE